jgi:ubiquinone/menaquinone biosynthesis C-methylase UbiE
MLTTKFRCPECGGSLVERPDALICQACGASVPVRDGLADFVRGRFDTILDVAAYDQEHGIDNDRPDRFYAQIRAQAGARWPASLGSVLEVGCGTGLFSRALLATHDTQDVVLTDVSVGMLRECRTHLTRLGLLEARNVAFATYSSNEACIRDAVFDTFIGTSVLHHILDVRSFLADVHRGLKPGGRAFFIEPVRRYHQATAQSLADIAAHLIAREEGGTEEIQPILNWLAEQRQSLMHKDDLGFLDRLEDKHQFLAEEFNDLASGIGFATAEAIPFGEDPTGVGFVRGLCADLGVAQPVRDAIVTMMPAVGSRFMTLLGPTDRSPTFLLWLTKARRSSASASRPRTDRLPTPPVGPNAGGVAPRWHIHVTARSGAEGTVLAIHGWYISNVDVVGLRVTLDGMAQDAPLWLPRPDVHKALNQEGQYAAWNALCCGVTESLMFGEGAASDGEHGLRVDVVLAGGVVARLQGPDRIRVGEDVVFSA